MADDHRGDGFWRPGDLERLVVLSPHLDDAVLGVGDLLAVAAGAIVVTVYAGSPDVYPDPPKAWVRQCGFGPGDDVAAIRRSEDERALARLGATAVHLPFVDRSHAPGADPDGPPEGLDDALLAALRSAAPTAVVVPVGLGHPEHRAVADAALRLRGALPGVAWILFAEIPYLARPGLLAQRLGELATAGVVLEPLVPPVDPMARVRKVAAMEAYVSQVGPLDEWWDLRRRVRETPESLWRIAA